MLGISIGFATVLMLSDGPGVAPVSPTEFREWFDGAREGSLVIPKKVDRAARRFQYVFVGGFGNEWTGGYFAQNAKELRSHGVARKAIHFVFPSSHKTIEENAEEVRRRFLAIAVDRPERLVVIAHSQGACDALAFALHEPEFVADRVEALFLIQGPFGGTALADYVRGEGPAMDRRMPGRYRLMANLMARGERFLLHRGKHGGLLGLTRSEARQFWARQLDAHAEAVAVVGPKTYFLESETPPDGLGFFQRASGWYLSLYDGPNDGVVAVRDQSLSGFGTCLGVIDCGHGDLTHRSRFSRQKRQLRQAFIRSLVMAVAEIERTENALAIELP